MTPRRLFSTISFCLLTGFLAAGCQTNSHSGGLLENPSFGVSLSEASAELDQIRASPSRLQRPLVIAGGIIDPGFAARTLQKSFGSLFEDRRIIAVSFEGCATFDQCADRLISRVERAFPGKADSNETIKVDAIGYSMGGLAIRFATMPRGKSRRLQVARLFSISTPHQGSDLARIPALTGVHRDMRPGSDFLRRVNRVPRGYAVYSYSRLGDFMVNPENAALPGEVPWWIDTVPRFFSHLWAHRDPRILLDIARRLSGKAGIGKLPRAPFP